MAAYTKEFFGCTVTYNPHLSKLTSIRLGGTAIAHICCEGPEGLEALPALHRELGGTLMPIGNGTNILARDGALPLLLVSMIGAAKPHVVAEDDHSVFVHVDAGCSLTSLFAYAAAQGFSGLEGLSGIPGNMGGAVRMNAGSYGVELGSLVQSLTVYIPGEGIRHVKASCLQPTYRNLALAGDASWYLVCSAVLRLQRSEPGRVKSAMRDIFAKKTATQPVGAFSAGCVFKNCADGTGAGKLLDSLGFKGKTHGGMQFSPIHANFLVNTGNGKSDEAFALVDIARDAARKSGYDLVLEVKAWS